MKHKILLTIISIFLSLALKGQEKITDIKYLDENFGVNSALKTEDRYWFNVVSNNGTHLILTSDGEQKNTVLFNLNGLNIIPQAVSSVIKAGAYYYLLIQAESSYHVIRTSYKNNRWYSEEVVKLIQSYGRDFLRISENRIFVVQKDRLRVLEIEGLEVTEIFRKVNIANRLTLEDFVLTADNSMIFFLYDSPKSLLSLLQIKSDKQYQIEWPGIYLERAASPDFCGNTYQIVTDKNCLHLHTGNQFFQINLDSLSYKQPFAGRTLSNILAENESIFIAEDISDKTPNTTTMHEFSKSGAKIRDFNIKINHLNQLISIDKAIVQGIQNYCADPKITSYNIETDTFLTDRLVQKDDFLLLRNRLYFNGSGYGSAYYQDGIVYKNQTSQKDLQKIFSLNHDERVFSLTAQKDTISLNENLFTPDTSTSMLSMKALMQKDNFLNTNFAQPYNLFAEQSNIHLEVNTNALYFQNKKGLFPIRYNSSEPVIYKYKQSLLTFRGQTYSLNNSGLYLLNDTTATQIVAYQSNPDNLSPYFVMLDAQDFFVFVTYDATGIIEMWSSNGNAQNTRKVKAPNLLNSIILGYSQQRLYYIKSAYAVYYFDGNEEKIVGTTGDNNIPVYLYNYKSSNFYFFNRIAQGIEVLALRNNQIQKIFTLSEFKANANISIAKVLSPASYFITVYDAEDPTVYFLKIDSVTNAYTLVKLDPKQYIEYYTENAHQQSYLNLTRRLSSNYSNRIIHIDEKNAFDIAFEFNSQNTAFEKVDIFTCINETFVFADNNSRMWRIDANTGKTSQFVSEKNNVRFHKIINNELYLNVCHDGECQLYKTNGTNEGTYQLTRTPLLVHNVYVVNNEVYVYGSDSKNIFQIWKLKSDDTQKVNNLFEEKEQPQADGNFGVILANEHFEPVTANENEENKVVEVYPNPFTGQLNLTAGVTGFQSITLINANGTRLFEANANQEKSIEALNVFLGNAKSGVYLLQINTGKTTMVKKIIKL